MDHPTQRLDPNDPDLPPDAGALDDVVDPPDVACPKCRYERLWTEVEENIAGLRGIVFKHQVGTSPWLNLPHFNHSPCQALVCPRCGFAEFYATQPKNLLGDT